MASRGGLAMQQSALKDCNQLKAMLEGAMKTYVSIGEDLQDGGEKFSSDVEGLGKRLLDLARMEHDLGLVGQAMEKVGEVEREYTTQEDQDEEEGPPQLEEVFDATLSSLREESYNPKTHLQWREFVSRAMEGGEEEEEAQEDEDADIVMAHVHKSLKCPLTRQYMKDPVTSKVCDHSYSREAIVQHIRNSRRQARCPVCNSAIAMGDLQADEKLRKQVRRAVRREGRNKEPEGVVSL